MADPAAQLVPITTPSTRDTLRRLELGVVRRLDGLLHGDYRGLVPATGSEPGETRRYAAGDDVRRIDWNVTARTREPHIRQTIADRELETRVLVDLSARTDFGTALSTKRDLATTVAAAIGLLTARTGNRFGATVLRGAEIHEVPPRTGRVGVHAVMERLTELGATEPTGRADLGAGLSALGGRQRRRGLCVVVADFLDQGPWLDALRRVTVRNETVAIEIVDPRELELPDVGIVNLVDPESGRTRRLDTRSVTVRSKYAEAAAHQRSQLAADIRSTGADHLQLRTDRDWLLDLARFARLRRERPPLPRSAGR